jgi:hypothetical protein
MHNKLGVMVAFGSLVLSPSGVRAGEHEIAPAVVAQVRGCAQASPDACRELAAHLAAWLDGGADSAVGLRLGMAAARAVAHPGRMVAGVAESCRSGYEQACLTLAQVLDRLFTGDDARLDRSTDRLLAREVAARVMADGAATLVSFRAQSRSEGRAGGRSGGAGL